MHNLILFTDGSLDTKTGIGFGAYLAVKDLDVLPIDLAARVKVRQFENTSSTKLELQTLLWAVDDVVWSNSEKINSLVIYSDSQNIVGLPARRCGLEQRDYYAGNGKRLNNAELYQQFFTVMDRCGCQIIKLDGHKPQRIKNEVDKIFSLVDKASRSALRHFVAVRELV